MGEDESCDIAHAMKAVAVGDGVSDVEHMTGAGTNTEDTNGSSP